MAGGGREGSPGRIVDDRFELVERLGRGGMGTVWRARDLVLERDVALKEVRAPAAGPGGPAEAVRERVLVEARALARISHPHVVTVHHVVAAEPFPWIVMELLPGRTLQTRLREGPVPPAEAVRYGRQLLSALRAAHAAGICHRDVKPANVLLRADGAAVLTDFGIARATDAGATGSGRIVGSPEYLAPERIAGGAGDAAGDLWSLGVLLYALTEGRPPFRRDTALATLAAVVEEPVPPPRRAGPLAALVLGLLAKDPAERPDAAALARQFDALSLAGVPTVTAPVAGSAAPVGGSSAASAPVTGPPPPPPPSGGPYGGGRASGDTPATVPGVPAPRRRRSGPLAAGAAVLLAAALTAGVLLLGEDGPPAGGGERAGAGTGTDAAAAGGAGESAGGAGQPSPPPAEPPGTPVTPTDDPAPGDDGETPDAGGDGEPGRSPEPDADPPAGAWIAQLYSEPTSSGTATRDRRLAAVRADVPDAEVLRSDDYASLRPGYWVIYSPGPFPDGRAAVAHCAGHGRTTADTCVGRYLSDSAEDRELICRPENGGTGRCER